MATRKKPGSDSGDTGVVTESQPKSKEKLAEHYQKTPIILVPAATGPAPLGLAFTGNSAMNAPWTALGTPAISIPMPVGNSLPLGLQLTAAPGQDARVLRTAVRIAPVFR